MIRAALLGANGRMGRRVAEVLPDGGLHVAISRQAEPGDPPVVALSATAFEGANVVIDFSTPAALDFALDVLNAPLVTGTTGLSPQTRAKLDRYAERYPVLESANFSTGVTLMLALTAQAAAALPDYDVEIVEAHHRHKEDAPSGTALALGDAVRTARGGVGDLTHGRKGQVGARPHGEIGFHALRGGEIIGEHEVWLVGPLERVKIGHMAQSRTAFAAGAVRAAEWLVGQGPGRYSMLDVLGVQWPTSVDPKARGTALPPSE